MDELKVETNVVRFIKDMRLLKAAIKYLVPHGKLKELKKSFSMKALQTVIPKPKREKKPKKESLVKQEGDEPILQNMDMS